MVRKLCLHLHFILLCPRFSRSEKAKVLASFALLIADRQPSRLLSTAAKILNFDVIISWQPDATFTSHACVWSDLSSATSSTIAPLWRSELFLGCGGGGPFPHQFHGGLLHYYWSCLCLGRRRKPVVRQPARSKHQISIP